MKLFISLGILGLVILGFSFTNSNALQAQPFAGGTGTQADPYQVATAAQLDSVRHYGSTLNTYFIQTADINLNISAYNTGEGWLPIANFRGFYNGDGHTISGLMINRPDSNNVGLFGTVNGASTTALVIQKLALNAPVVTGNNQVGALVGDITFGRIEQVGIKGGTVTVKGNNGGGIVGALGTGTGGATTSTARIDDNYSTARVIGPDRDGTGYGGLIGLHRERATMRRNLAAGEVSGPAGKVGGLVGHMLKDDDRPINDNFYLNTNGTDIGSRKVGIQFTAIGTGRSTSQMKQQAFYIVGSSDPDPKLNFITTWIMLDEGSVLPELRVFVTDFSVMYAGGSGTQADPYQIATAKQLYHVRQLPAAYFQQTADIDLGVAPYDTTNNAAGWTPIEQFNGSFNGNGFTISNLLVNPAVNPSNSVNNLGLFAKVGTNTITASLENITLLNPFVTNGDNVGALAGTITRTNLINTHIRGGSVIGSGTVGGIAGYGSSSMLTKSSATGMTITNSGSSTGGLAGSLIFVSSITDSYAANNIQGGSHIAGLVDQFWGTVTNSYSASMVSGSGGIGGLVGRAYFGQPITINDSYFNYDSTRSKNVTTIYGDSLNTTRMRQRASFPGWDFSNTWFIDEGVSFPGLLENRGNNADITGNEGWRMLASPLQSKSIGTILDPLWTQGFTGADTTIGTPNVLFYNESSQTWSAPTDTSVVPAPGTGFIVYVYSDDNSDRSPEGFPKRLTHTGTPVSGQVSVNLSYTNSGNPNNVGFNLVGNPYPTTINWDASRGWTRKGTRQSFYVWNNAASSYQAWSTLGAGTKADGLIAPWQGFWVEANAANPQIVFTDTVRNAGGVLLKQAKPVIPKIDLELEGGGFSSRAIVLFHEKAEMGKDSYDAYKLQSLNPDYLLLGTSIDGLEAMDIQALPYSEEPMELDLVIEGSNLNGEFILNWASTDIPQGLEISLLDNKTGKTHTMDADGRISFSLNTKTKASVQRDSGTIPKAPIRVVKAKTASSPRFVLRIQGSTPVSNELDSSLPTKVALHQNYPNPFNPGTTINYEINKQTNVRLEVFDLLGRKVATLVNNETQRAGRYNVRFDATALSSGVYLYRLDTGNKVLVKKMTVIK